ncbi:hypothetical protein FNF27_03465 [Cafeteria roenbergensis]|uniref:C2 domain-containing protein n=1 Tax=Cafeteria roenbergensis TaxID=33653 RepID=A0A5A8ECZ6_CAFRO|nr:hypothetical protein FNF27_03465 [Cafeteria roenbergensis]
MSVLRFVVQGVGLVATAETQGAYIILGPDPGSPLYTSVLCENAIDPTWDEVVLEGSPGEYDEDTDVMVSIFEVDGDGVSVLIGTTQVSVAEMQRGARDTPPRRFALVNHEGAETGHVAFLGASAGPRPAVPSAISIPGRPGDAGQSDSSAPVVIGAESPMAGPLTPATAATYPRQGRLRPRSPPPPSGEAGDAADSGSASDASGFAASGGDGKAAGGARAEDVAAAAAARRLELLRRRVDEMNELCRTAEDANARAARETKWRQELQEDKRALQERVQSVLSDLRREETARLDAERRATEAARRADAAVADAERARAEAEVPRGPSPRAAAADAQRLRAALDEAKGHKQAAAMAEARATGLEASLKKAEAAAAAAARDLARARAEAAATEKALRARARAAEEAASEAKAATEEAEARASATSRVVADGFAAAARSLGLSLSADGGDADSAAAPAQASRHAGEPSGPHAGVPRAVLDADWEAWDSSLIAAAVEAVASAATGLATAPSVSQSSPASPAARASFGTASDAGSESAAVAAAAAASAELRRQMAQQGADHARAVEDKNKLIRDYAASPTSAAPSPPLDPPASAVRITARNGRPFHNAPARRTPESGTFSSSPGRVPTAGQGAAPATGAFFA